MLDLKTEIKERINLIFICREMISAINSTVVKLPGISELASEVINLERELITKYTNEIKELKSGKS